MCVNFTSSNPKNNKTNQEEGITFHKSSENCGGLRGELTTGERIVIRVTFESPSTLEKVAKEGRHDLCIGPRAVPVVEAMACIISADHLL